MGTWLWTTVTIGGKAPKAAWRDIFAAAEDEFMYSFESLNPNEAANYNTDGHPLVISGETSYGNAEGTLEACRKHGLTYQRVCEGYGSEFGPEIETWKAGWEKPITQAADEAHEVTITLPGLKAALKAKKTLGDVIGELSVGDLEVPPMEVER